MTEHVVVVGAGAWGLSVALALSDGGAANVTVVDAAPVGAGASARAAGILSTHLRTLEDIRLTVETRERLLKLEAEHAPDEPVLMRAPKLTLAGAKDKGRLEALAARVRQAGCPARIVEGRDATAEAGPVRGADDLSGVLSPDGYVATPPQALALLVRALKARGVTIRTGSAARLRPAGAGLAASVGGKPLPATDVVVAAGAWASGILAPLGLRPPLAPYRTQLAHCQLPPGAAVPIVHDASLGAYWRPASGGAWVGDGTETWPIAVEEWSHVASDAFRATVERVMRERLPQSARLSEAWTGLCVATPDRWPLLGPVPGVEGLHLMAGDNGYGFMRSAALGARVAAGVLTGSVPADMAAMAAARFDLRDPPAFEVREGFEL